MIGSDCMQAICLLRGTADNSTHACAIMRYIAQDRQHIDALHAPTAFHEGQLRHSAVCITVNILYGHAAQDPEDRPASALGR